MTEKPNEPPAGGACLTQPVRLWRVRGICLVPTEVELRVEAADEKDAVKKALASDWQSHICGNSGDETAAFDWEPVAEEVLQPNATSAGDRDNNQPHETDANSTI